MTTLTFDVEGLAKALIERLIKVMDVLMEEFYNEATRGFSGKAKADSVRIGAKESDSTIHDAYDKVGKFIVARCEFYANAIIQSFGTGSAADTRPFVSYWEEYRKMKQQEHGYLFNPDRKDSEIVGRPAGSYTDIWGKPRKSSGRARGRSLEGMIIADSQTGEEGPLIPQNPTYSIQNAEKWINQNGQTKIERRIQVEVERFLAEEAGKYFLETRG